MANDYTVGWCRYIKFTSWQKVLLGSTLTYAFWRSFYHVCFYGQYRVECVMGLIEWVSEVAQSCPTLCDPMDCSLPGSSIHGIFQAIVLEWGAIFFSNTWKEIAQSCPTLSDPMDCSLPGSSIHGIFQARVLEWVAIAFSGVDHNKLENSARDGNTRPPDPPPEKSVCLSRSNS